MNNPAFSQNRNRSAMTLIELLVVIAIIGVLFACIYPALKAGMGSANRIKCLNNLKQLGMAAELYAQDNDNRFSDIDIWPPELSPYLLKTLVQDMPTHSKNTPFWCPSAIPAQVDPNLNGNVTYGINVVGYAGQGRLRLLSNNGQPVVLSKLIAFLDASGKNVWEGGPERVSLRHGAGYNVVFADGHVEALQTQQYAPGSKEWKNLLWGYTRY